jgi:putative spermidine/putrescine transport system substrate-binding protein
MRALTLLAVLPPLLCAVAAAAPPQPVPATDDMPQPVTAAIAPGPFKDPARRILLKPYAQATGTDPGDAGWDGTQEGLKKLAAAHAADLALLDGPALAAACHAQIVEKLDWGALGRDRFLPEAASDCGAGAFVAATLLTWDRDKLQGTPTWSDFWDVAKHPGRRGLRRGARGNLEIALLADGVAPGDIYRTLRSADGVDRAFRKLDQLKPYVMWWDQPGQPAQLLASAKVLLTSAPSAPSAPPAAQRGSAPHGPGLSIGRQWAGSLIDVTSWAVLNGAPHAAGARAAIAVATDPAREAEFDQGTGLGPSTRTALSLLPQPARSQSPSLPANVQAGLVVDEGFWLDNGSRLEARFATWVGN